MLENTPIFVGEYYENFINEQVCSGRYTSANEVVRTALRIFEQQEIKIKNLVNELKIGEQSKMISDFDRNKELKNLHAKSLHNEI